MGSRKIMALGKSSLVISLPKEWLKINNLERGNNVTVTIQNDRTLSVNPSTEVIETKKEAFLSVEADEPAEFIIRRVIGCYLNGYDTIRLKSKNIFTVEQRSSIRRIVRSLYMRIIESSANLVVFQTLLDESMASVQSGIERMHIITSSMGQDVLNAMKEWDEDLAKSVISLEEDVDQFMYFLLRLIRSAAIRPTLAKQLELDMIDCLDSQTLVHRIEQVADHTTNIANGILNLFEERMFMPKDTYPVLIESAEVAYDAYTRAVDAYLSKDVGDVNEIIDLQVQIEELEQSITPLPYSGESESKDVLCHICVIRDSIKRISEFAADIAELTIDRTFKAVE
jgi:phosphate uptake regulator